MPNTTDKHPTDHVFHSNLPFQPELAQKPSPPRIRNCIALSGLIFIRLDRRHVRGFLSVEKCTQTLACRRRAGLPTKGEFLRDGTTPHVEAEMLPFYTDFPWQVHYSVNIADLWQVQKIWRPSAVGNVYVIGKQMLCIEIIFQSSSPSSSKVEVAYVRFRLY